jgi:hypothetical protein
MHGYGRISETCHSAILMKCYRQLKMASCLEQSLASAMAALNAKAKAKSIWGIYLSVIVFTLFWHG